LKLLIERVPMIMRKDELELIDYIMQGTEMKQLFSEKA
jgi:hypothetical protein